MVKQLKAFRTPDGTLVDEVEHVTVYLTSDNILFPTIDEAKRHETINSITKNLRERNSNVHTHSKFVEENYQELATWLYDSKVFISILFAGIPD